MERTRKVLHLVKMIQQVKMVKQAKRPNQLKWFSGIKLSNWLQMV